MAGPDDEDGMSKLDTQVYLSELDTPSFLLRFPQPAAITIGKPPETGGTWSARWPSMELEAEGETQPEALAALGTVIETEIRYWIPLLTSENPPEVPENLLPFLQELMNLAKTLEIRATP